MAHIHAPSFQTAKQTRFWPLAMLAAAVFLALCLSASAARAQEPATTAASNETSNRITEDELAELRKKFQRLDSEVTRLRLLVAKLEKYQQIDYLREQLVKEEQRAEALQAQLGDISAKEGPLQDRVEEIDAQLRPQNLEQSMAGVGSTRPEEARDAVRNRLSNEKRRLQSQIDLLRQSRTRLQASLTTADASIARLRQRLNEISR